MLIYQLTHDPTPDDAAAAPTPEMEQLYRLLDIQQLPTETVSSVSGENELLDFNMQDIHYQYNYLYLPEPELYNNLLCPLAIIRWKTGATHFVKRSGWQCYLMIYTHSGTGALNVDGKLYDLHPDSICLIDCRKQHHFYASSPEGWEYSLIHFDGNTASYLCDQILSQGCLYSHLQGSDIYHQYHSILSLAKNMPKDFDLLFHHQLTSLLVKLCCVKAASYTIQIPQWLSEVQAYIYEHYNMDWSIKDLAARAHLSESRFAHVFTNICGMSPMAFRDYLRIEHAKIYLCNTNIPVDQIRELVGYKTLSNFYAKFNAKTGVSPSVYRKNTPAAKEQV